MFNANLFSATIYGDGNKPGLLQLENSLQRVEDPSGTIAYFDKLDQDLNATFPHFQPSRPNCLEVSINDYQAWKRAYENGIIELAGYLQVHQPTLTGYRVRILGDYYRRGSFDFDHLSSPDFDKVEGKGSYQGMMTSGKVPRKIELTGIIAKILSTMARGELERATAQRQVITYGKPHNIRGIHSGVYDLALPYKHGGTDKQIQLAVTNDYLFMPYDQNPEWLRPNLEFIGEKGLATIKFEIHYQERDQPAVIRAA